jgi:hypothetical protein
MANKAQSAAFALAQVLKQVIAGLPQAFATENQLLAAYNAVDNYISANVPASARDALFTGEEVAPVEDVSKRPPPAGYQYSIPSNVPQIDYNALAMAMVRAQQQIAAENAQVPETTLVESTPAPASNTEVEDDEQPHL